MGTKHVSIPKSSGGDVREWFQKKSKSVISHQLRRQTNYQSKLKNLATRTYNTGGK